ncbi:GIY-YIG nuclease family protein [Micromonospora aurantiaca (nom. illeg.)]
MKGCGYSGCSNTSAVNKYGVELCLEHGIVLHNTVRVEAFSKKVSRLYENGDLTQHSAGITYIIQLPNHNIKIGTTKNGRTLYSRLRNLSNEQRGKVTLLATLPGGETQEAVLHARFSEYRRYDLFVEQFSPAAELFYFAKETGLESEGLWAKQAFDLWEFTPGTIVEPTEEDRKYLAVACTSCGAEVDEPCSWKVDTAEAIHASRKSRLDYLLTSR